MISVYKLTPKFQLLLALVLLFFREIKSWPINIFNDLMNFSSTFTNKKDFPFERKTFLYFMV